MSDSDDIVRLNEICRRELLGRKVNRVKWLGFADMPLLDFESLNTERIYIRLGHVDWLLTDQNTDQVIVTSKQPFDVFRVPVEKLTSTSVTRFEVFADRCLAFEADFDNGMRLRLDACETFYDDIDTPCWTLGCSDAHVILVGMKLSTWRRIHKNEPVYGDPKHPSNET